MVVLLSVITPEALTQLREISANEECFKEGDIFRVYRLYQLQNNYTQETKWRARFKSGEQKKIAHRLEMNKPVSAAFNRLLPYTGLWDPVNMSQIKCILGLRCHEV
jgi:hypothetical protein